MADRPRLIVGTTFDPVTLDKTRQKQKPWGDRALQDLSATRIIKKSLPTYDKNILSVAFNGGEFSIVANRFSSAGRSRDRF